MTKGYDPYEALWILFHQHGWGLLQPKFTEEHRREITSVIEYVHEKRCPITDGDLHPEGSTFVERFMKLMPEGTALDVLNQPMTQGLLECLNPYQGIEPYRNPDRMIHGWDPRGVYDHFKGGVYLLRGLSHWASGEQDERVVEYTSLLHGTHHARKLEEWCSVVEWPDGKYRSRFVFRGVDLCIPPPSFKVPSPEIVHVDEGSRRQAQRPPLRPPEGGPDEGGGPRVPF